MSPRAADELPAPLAAAYSVTGVLGRGATSVVIAAMQLNLKRPVVIKLLAVQAPGVFGLDSGCIWGGRLSALRLEDRRLFQVTCPGYQEPGDKG